MTNYLGSHVLDMIKRELAWINVNKNSGVVLDCFMGGGSTGVACMNTGRKFIGIELDDTYFEIAEKRIAESLVNQGIENVNNK